MKNEDKNKKNIDSEQEIIEQDIESEEHDKIQKIKNELKECRKKAAEFLAGWQRTKADLINYKKEEEDNRESVIKHANERILGDLLNVLDSFDKALSDPVSGEHKDGLIKIRNQIFQIMRGFGIENIEAGGKKFNPAEHESIADEEVETKEQDQTVLEEIQKGYKIYSKVLRPARVKIGVFKNK